MKPVCCCKPICAPLVGLPKSTSVSSSTDCVMAGKGLLQTPDSSFGSIKFVMALIAECLGTLIFTFAGSATPSGAELAMHVLLMRSECR